MNKKELQKIWNEAETPIAEDMKGEYQVKMLSGPFLWLNIPGDRKMFDSGSGFNILGKKKEWGFFFLEESPGKLVINYNRVPLWHKNGRIVRTIRDHIRYAPKYGYYIGKFNMVIKGKLRFLGWFTLTKIKEEVKNEEFIDYLKYNPVI